MQVLAGSEQHVHSIFEDFIAHGFCHILYEFDIPRRSYRSSDRKAGAVKGGFGPFPGGIDAEACRAVGQHCVGNAETRDCLRGAGCAGYQDLRTTSDAGDHAAPAGSDHESGLFLKCHCGKNFVNIVFREFRLRHHGQYQSDGSHGHEYLFHK